jgi:hypothetical protein
MKTRSQRQEELLKNAFVFDFDHSSECWLRNKTKLANGCYQYIDEKPNRYNTRSKDVVG